MVKTLQLKLVLLLCLIMGAGTAWADDTYVKVTSTNELVTGSEYILATTSSNTTYVASGFSSAALSTITTGFSVSGNTITVTTGSPLVFTLGGSSSGYTLQYNNSGTVYFNLSINKVSVLAKFSS